MLREQLMMFSKINPAVLATLFFGLTLSGSALPCSTDGWDSESGMVAVGQPFGATPPDINGVARFEEFCALVAAGTGYVQTNAPSHSEVTNRFYVWADVSGTGDADILVGYSAENGTGELFSIAYDGTNFDFASSGGSDSAAAADGWNLIEYHWNGTTFEYWVNADATTDSPTGSFSGGGAATLESVRLGLPNGLGGFTGAFNYDTFEMHNMTAIGPELECDADGSGSIDVNDAATVVDEIFGVLSSGYPDCDLSGGAIDVNDASAVVDAIFGG
jgi:hypothetical protein